MYINGSILKYTNTIKSKFGKNFWVKFTDRMKLIRQQSFGYRLKL